MRFDVRLVGMIGLLGVVAFLTVYPLGMIVYGSFRSVAPGVPGGYFTLNGFRTAYTDPAILKALMMTLSIGLTRTLITLFLATFLCWIIIRTNTPGRGFLEFGMWINYFLPTLPMTMGWILLLDPSYGLINQWAQKLPFVTGPPFNIYSFGGIIWSHLAFSTSVRVLMFSPAFRNMDAALEESARMSGCSNMGTLVRITFPLLMPSILGTTLLGFIRSLESFEVELLLGMPAKIFVYSTKVYDLLRWEPPQYPPAMALSTIFMAIVFGLIFLNRWVIQRRQYTTVTGKGYRATPIALGKLRWFLFGLCVAYILIFLFLPFTILVIGTFMKVSGMFNLPSPWTMVHWKAVLNDPLFVRSFVNSLIMACSAALIGMTFYSLISYITRRSKLRGRGLLEFFSWLPWAVPGLLLAVGLLWVFLGSVRILVGLYGTLYILILAMIIKEMPMGTRVMDGTMVQIGKELEESSRMSGAGWIYTFRRILVPLLAPTYTASAVMLFLSSIRDISLVVLLYSPKWRVLSILMLEHYIGMSPEKGMVVGLVITAICITVAITARSLGMKLGTRD